MTRLLVLALAGLFACGAYAAEAKKDAMTPQQEKMKACNEQAGDKKGDERKAFMKTCLSAKPATSKNKMAECNAKTKGLSKAEGDKVRSECMKAS